MSEGTFMGDLTGGIFSPPEEPKPTAAEITAEQNLAANQREERQAKERGGAARKFGSSGRSLLTTGGSGGYNKTGV